MAASRGHTDPRAAHWRRIGSKRSWTLLRIIGAPDANTQPAVINPSIRSHRILRLSQVLLQYRIEPYLSLCFCAHMLGWYLWKHRILLQVLPVLSRKAFGPFSACSRSLQNGRLTLHSSFECLLHAVFCQALQAHCRGQYQVCF